MINSPQEQRLRKIFSLMNDENLDALLVSCPENRFYLSGFYAEDVSINESAGVLFISPDFLVLLTDSRYVEAARLEASLFKTMQYNAENTLESIVSKLCAERQVKQLGVEAEFLSAAKYIAIEETLRKEGIPASLVLVKQLVEKVRAVKEELELSSIRKSLHLSEQVMEEVYGLLKPGLTEKEVAWFIEKRLRELGAESVSFPPIVAGGARAALPHACPEDRPLQEGEPIVIDMGAKLDHYCSDITRTVFLGYIPDKWMRIYEVVMEAQRRAQSAAKPGMRGEDLDAVARSFIEQSGYGDYFQHGLGHGVGLAIHELPSIRVRGKIELEPGMVFTVEPGIYLPGEGGIRLENMVVMREDGVEVLNRLPVEPPPVIR
ncbi:MAG: M24 family metallopeptidase [Thermodesulforhabdaceae bacterium]